MQRKNGMPTWWARHRRDRLLVAAVVCGGAFPLPARPLEPAERRQPTHPSGPEARVTLVVQDSTVRYVINELTRQAHLRSFFYNSTSLSRRIAVRVVNVPVMEALTTALRETGLTAALAPDGDMVVIRPRVVSGPSTDRDRAQGGTVMGRVTDSTSGAGLKGASVRVEGTPKLAAVTGDSGQFVLHNVPAGDQVLQVRLFSYRPAIRTVTVVEGERTTVRIALASVPTVLSGVVTTATGVQRKVEVGNDITTINVDSVMKVAPVSTVTDLLETRVPGLTVQHTSGVPGSPSRIRIRGVSSITGNNDPIVIVDGVQVYASQSDSRNANLAQSKYPAPSVKGASLNKDNTTAPAGYAAPSPLDQIDPNSIETIEVFKGPSASAMYGSDAANGVIVITTKHGRVGPTHWSLNLGQGVNWLPGKWPTHYFKFGSEGALNFQQTYCQWYDPHCVQDSLVQFQALNDSRFSPFAHGSDQTAALTISGGVSTLQYSLSGSAAGNVGNLKLPAWEQHHYEQVYGPVPGWMRRPDNYTTYGMSGQLTTQPTSQTRVTLSSNLFNSDQQQGSLQQAISQLEGAYLAVIKDTLVWGSNRSGRKNLLLQNEVERATARTQTSTNALTLNWQPWNWLPLAATGGLSTVQRVNHTYIPYGISVGGVDGGTDTTGSYGLGRGTSEDKTLDLNTSVPSRWLTTAVGANFHSNSINDFSAYTSQLGPGISTPTQFLYLNNTGPTQATSGASTYGWYVEPRLNFYSRFFVAPGFRLDGGSASGAHGGFTGGGLTGFPKIDLSWLPVDRDHPRAMLDLLRPRVAFGYAGTQPAPDAKLRLLNKGGGQTVVLNDSTLRARVIVSTLGNTRLRPETSRELEGGVDAELWRGRLTLTWTQYDKTRYNAIIQIPIAPSVYSDAVDQPLSGVISTQQSMQSVNVGVVRNTGTELTWNAAVLESRALGWQVGGNFFNVNNRVVRLAPGFTPNKLLGIVPGYPLFSQWVRPITGYADADQNGVIGPNEYVVGDSAVYVGQAEPKYQLNLNTTVTLLNGRLSATATFAYQDGLTQNNLTALQSQAVALLPNAPGTSLGTQVAFLAALCSASNSNSGNLTVGINDVACVGTPIGMYQTVNTLRFNALSINYTLPTGLTSRLHVPHASIALQGQNLGLHTNYRGMDPNVNAFSTVSNGGDQTADLGQIPEPRVWWLKLNLGN